MNGPIMYQLSSKTHLNQFKKYMQPLTNCRKKKVCQLPLKKIMLGEFQLFQGTVLSFITCSIF